MKNYKLLIQYDGTNYAGWQSQINARTIQDEISKTINVVLNENINVIGAGRTDSGVHALGQVANFKTEQTLDLYRFKYQLNSILDKDISIVQIEEKEESFHSRYDAKKRSYIYLISKYKSPFYSKYSYFCNNKIDCNRLNFLSKAFIGERDYTSFSRKNSDTENKVCCIYDAAWKEKKDNIIFKIEADRFLHGMVRTITGTLLKTLKYSYDKNYIEEIILNKDRESAGEAVPAKGLFLFKVKY